MALAASVKVSAKITLSPESLNISLPSSRLVPSMRTMRHLLYLILRLMQLLVDLL